MHHIASYTSQKRDDATEMCKPQNLSEVARMTHRVFREAIAKHVVGERYGRKESQHSHLRDMAMLMVPRLRSGKYLKVIRDLDVGKTGGFIQTAGLMKEKLWRGVTDLVERVIVAKRARDGSMNMDHSSKQQNQHQEPSGSGQLSPEPEEAGDDRSFAVADLFDDLDEGEEGVSTRERTPREEAENAVAQYKAMKIPTDFAKCVSGQNSCQFWAQHGNLAPHMKHVAQALLGMPASSAVLERDFCIAGQVISMKRGSLDPAMVEMLLFLRAEYEEIPQEIRSLNEAEMRAAIPQRLKDVVWLKEVEPLETGPSPSASSDEPEVIISDNEDSSADEQDDSEGEQDDVCRNKGKAKMDVRGWGGSSGGRGSSMKKRKQG